MSLTVEQKLRLPKAYREHYDRTKMDIVEIDGNIISGYMVFSYYEAKVYHKEPIRSAGGAIENLNSYATYLQPRLKIEFTYMTMETYRVIVGLLRSKNEFTVKCYDPYTDTRVTRKMYFYPNEYPTLFNKNLKTLGAINYTIELAGTNSDLNKASIIYHSNPPDSTGVSDYTESKEDVIIGQEVLIGKDISIKDESFSGQFVFSKWSTTEDGQDNAFFYLDNSVYTLNEDLVLYAQWTSSNEHVLFYDYGKGEQGGKESTKITYNDAYGTLPSTNARTVSYEGQQYTPYVSAGWYRTSEIGLNSKKILPTDLYVVNGNSIIYQIFTPKIYKINFISAYPIVRLQRLRQEYNTKIFEPEMPTRDGYIFDGWYTTSTFDDGTNFDFNTMPPVDVTLYGKWSQE